MKKQTELALAMAAGMALSGSLAAAEEYKVGVLLPFSGVYAGLGAHIENGFKLGLEHYGADLGDNTITTIRADTEANPGSTLAKTKKMVLQDKADVLVGIVSSAVLGGMRDFIHNSGTPLVVANAGNNDMTGIKCSPNIIRVSFSNAQITRPMGTWLAWIARATPSVLKAHRSSSEPPPRPTMMTSTPPRAFSERMPSTISSGAPSPCTLAAHRTSSTSG